MSGIDGPAFDPESFAHEWIAGWNARDLDRILDHYADDVIFSSPKAQAITGSARVVGKPALAAYWRAALDRGEPLHFELERVYAGADCVAIAYIRNGALRVVETLEFENGRVVRGCVAHAPV